MDLRINGLNNVSSQGTSRTEQTEQNSAEIMLFAPSSPEAQETQETDGQIRRTLLDGYKGNVASKDFNLRRRINIKNGYQIVGNIGNQEVDVEERQKLISPTNQTTYKGKIGANPIIMQASEKLFSTTNKKIYTGQYKGKTFTIEYSNEHAVLNDGDKVMKGTYGGKPVEIKYEYRVLKLSDDIQENQLPEGFEDVVALIMTVDCDETVRRSAKNARRMNK